MSLCFDIWRLWWIWRKTTLMVQWLCWVSIVLYIADFHSRSFSASNKQESINSLKDDTKPFKLSDKAMDQFYATDLYTVCCWMDYRVGLQDGCQHGHCGTSALHGYYQTPVGTSKMPSFCHRPSGEYILCCCLIVPTRRPTDRYFTILLSHI